MSNCDEIFQQIQALEAQKRGLNDALGTLDQVDEPDPVNRFVFRGKDGQNYEASFDEVFRQITQDPLATKAFAEMAAQNRLKPTGAEGQFENFSQMVDRMGLDRAADLGALLTRFTGDWEKVNPNDFYRTIAVADPEQFKARIAKAFDEAGIAISQDRLAQMISTNVAPFLDIVSKQDKLRVLGAVTRNNVVQKVKAMVDQIAETGVAPTVEAKRAFMRDYYTAIYAHRSERIASRRSGQLLQNYQRVIDEDAGATESLFRLTGIEAKAEAEQLAKDVITMRPEELVQEGSFAKRVIEAADKGAAGQLELQELIDTAKRSGVDASSTGMDADWERTWKRNARAAYKDTILFSPRSQTLSNYLSQKIVYLTEGYRRMTGQNAWQLLGARQRGHQLAMLEGDPEGLASKLSEPVYINPLATGFFRDALKAQLDGSRIAVEAGLKANAVIKQTWGESLQKHFMEGDTPFAGNVDNFIAKGQMSIEDQYRAAQEVLNEPWDKSRFLFQMRDKLHVSLKYFINQKIYEATGQKLPIYSALQLMGAVDQRMGIRTYMSQRANDLILEQAAKFPDRTLKEWSEAVDQELYDQIYRADPSPAQIEAARQEFNMSKPTQGADGLVEGFTDDEVAAFIASDKLGYPVQVLPEQLKARDISIALRMQQRQTQGLPGVIDTAVSRARQGELGDVMVSFWRSPFNQQIWDLTLAGSPFSAVYKVAKASGKMAGGKLTPELAAEAQSAAVIGLSMMGLFLGLRQAGAITGNGPVDPNARKQWMQRMNAEGRVPNSVFGIPFNMGGIPVLNSLFLVADAADLIEQGQVSKFDQTSVFEGLLQLVAGQVMRTPGFRQVQMLYDALANGSENAWEKLGRWAAFMANGQFNPVSGGERLMEWATGTQWQDLAPPNRAGVDERYALDQLPDDHPLNAIQESLRSYIYMSNPGLAHWLGLRVKEKTWLGRDVRRPDGIFRGEWPVGVPGIWEFNGGEYRVERKLEQLGMLNPPGIVMLGKSSSGVPLTSDAIEEINDYNGSVRPSLPYSRDAKHGGTVVWRGPETTVVRNGREVPAGRVMVDLTRLVDEATQGRTVREALDYVLESPQWSNWDADPRYTTNPKVRDMTKEMRRNQPGPFVLQKIKDYYADLAESAFMESGTPAAQQVMQDVETLRLDGSNLRSEQRQMDLMSR